MDVGFAIVVAGACLGGVLMADVEIVEMEDQAKRDGWVGEPHFPPL